MIIYCVDVFVVEGKEEEFRKATVNNHKATRKELGNLRFDVLQDEVEPTHFILYEAYRSEEAVAAHKETSHYKTWRETVAPWMAKPRAGRKYDVIAPLGIEAW